MTKTAAISGGRPAHRVIFDGQSLNAPTFPRGSYCHRAMQGRNVPWRIVAIGGTAWSTLATTAATRCYDYGPIADNSVLVMCGGSTDLFEGDAGATVMSDMVSYADNARTAGFDSVIAFTIPPSVSYFTEAMETQRGVFNPLLVADAGSDFDAVIDLTGDASFEDSESAYYLGDNLHWSALGEQAAADALSSALDTALA